MSDASWAGVAMAAIALGGTIATALNNRRIARDKMEYERQTARDKLEFDAKFVSLEAKTEACEEKHAACEEKHDGLEKKLDECQKQHQNADVRLTALEDKIK